MSDVFIQRPPATPFGHWPNPAEHRLRYSEIYSRTATIPTAGCRHRSFRSSVRGRGSHRCPKSIDSMRDSGSAAQSATTKCPAAQELLSWRAVAMSSLPVPVSPLMRMLTSLPGARATRPRHASRLGLLQTMPQLLMVTAFFLHDYASRPGSYTRTNCFLFITKNTKDTNG